MPNGYRATLVEQVQKYTPVLPAGDAESVRTMLTVGELALAALDLVSALVKAAAPVDPQDVPTLRRLLESATLPPDTPPDLIDRLTVA